MTADTLILPLVHADLDARAAKGMREYGRPLTADPCGRDHLRDAYEEALDLVCYLRAELEYRKGA